MPPYCQLGAFFYNARMQACVVVQNARKQTGYCIEIKIKRMILNISIHARLLYMTSTMIYDTAV